MNVQNLESYKLPPGSGSIEHKDQAMFEVSGMSPELLK